MLTLLTTLGCAIAAGVFFAFSTFVMQAFGRLPPAQGIGAMQMINLTAVRPAFMIQLFGTAALCLALAIWAGARWGERWTSWTVAGAAIYLVGVIAVTAAFHVPRNDQLASMDPQTGEAQRHWSQYQREWTLGNHVRTLASLGATACFAMALRVQ